MSVGAKLSTYRCRCGRTEEAAGAMALSFIGWSRHGNGWECPLCRKGRAESMDYDDLGIPSRPAGPGIVTRIRRHARRAFEVFIFMATIWAVLWLVIGWARNGGF